MSKNVTPVLVTLRHFPPFGWRERIVPDEEDSEVMAAVRAPGQALRTDASISVAWMQGGNPGSQPTWRADGRFSEKRADGAQDQSTHVSVK